jgi:tetratricopeptide (TPR) repeat protein
MAQISQEREEDSDIILKYLDQAVALNPKIQDYYFLRSEIFVNKKNFQSAIIDLTEIINIDSTNNLAIKAYAILGEILMNIEKYNESKSFLNKGILYEYKFKEEVSVCYAVRAKLNQIYGEKENVISDYTKAIELCQEGKSDLYNDRGIFYQDSLQNYDMALHDFNLAIKYDSLSWNAFHNKGRLFFLKKNYLDAQKNLLKALEIDQTNILSLNLLGLIYKELKQFQLSIFQYSEGIKHEKSNPKFASYCYLNRADLYILLGKYKDALSDISQAIDLSEKEDKVYAYIQRAYLFIDQLKNYNLALNDFNSAIKISPNQSDLYYDRSNLYFENIKNFEKAIEDLVVFLKYEPNNIDALNQIGLIYEEMNKIEDAIYYYQKGINSKELNSNSKAYCFANLGRLNSNIGNFKDALYFYDKAIEISDTTFKAEFYSERGLLYEEDLKDFDKALVDYSLAIAFNPRDYENWYNRGLLLTKKIHKTEAATYDFLKAHELNPTDLDLLLELTNLLIQLNRINEVENIVYKFESMNQINDSTKANISLIHAIIQRSKNNFSDALDYYNLSIKLMPKVDFFWAQRAWFFIEYLNDLNRGMEDLNKAIELDENNSSYYILRSKIFLKLNDKKNQLNDIESALNNQPNSVYLKTQKAIALSINNETNKSLKLINNAISKDSLNYLFYLCKAKIFLYLKDYVNALELLNKIDTMEPNDPEIDFLKGRIYEFNGEFHNAAFMYLRSENKLNRGDFWINDDFGNEIQKSEFYYMVGKFYEKIKEQALMCKMYNISLDLINKDQLFRLKVIKKEIEEKLNYCQN